MMAIQKVDNEYLNEIECARKALRDLIIRENIAAGMLHLAFVDAGTYDAKTNTGGPNGSSRFPEEHFPTILRPIEICAEVISKHPIITYADIYQLAGMVAVEVAGGPKIDFVPGRVDSMTPDKPGLFNPHNGPAQMRTNYYQMGFTDKDIVAISGAHTLGRAHKDISGFEGPFTRDPNHFTNSYYRELLEGEIKGVLKLPTDKALVEDPEFKKYVQRYAQCERTFYKEYAASHKKMLELGLSTPKCY